MQEVREGAEPGWVGRYDAKMRAGMVYAMTNAAAGNEVIAFRRANDGTLTRMNAYPTGGKGTGTMKVCPRGAAEWHRPAHLARISVLLPRRPFSLCRECRQRQHHQFPGGR